MKLVSYLKDEHEQLALVVNNLLFDMDEMHPELPSSMGMFLNYWEDYLPLANAINEAIIEGRISQNKGILPDISTFLAPAPHPASLRNAYAFQKQVASMQPHRKVNMNSESDNYPVFYFGNHHSVQGPGEVRCMPKYFQKPDFDMGCAVIICKQGRNITTAEADNYIGGFMIMNNFTARHLQQDETILNLVPAKGKDFATVTGPWLVTPDELEAYKIPAKPGHAGASYNLWMKCRVNGVQMSEVNLRDLDWTFAEIIESCSYGADIYPGDIIGSGTIETGSFFELNRKGRLEDPNYIEAWLKAGDVVEMEIEGLGMQSSTIVVEGLTIDS